MMRCRHMSFHSGARLSGMPWPRLRLGGRHSDQQRSRRSRILQAVKYGGSQPLQVPRPSEFLSAAERSFRYVYKHPLKSLTFELNVESKV